MATNKTAIELIEGLHKCCLTLSGIGEALEKLLAAEEATSKIEPVPESPPTLVEVRGVLANLSRAGKTAEVRSLLLDLGYERLSDVPATLYKEVLDRAEVITHA